MEQTILIPVELSRAGVAAARETLVHIEAVISNGNSTAAQNSQGTSETHTREADIVTVYEHARPIAESRTPDLLELFARTEHLLTPEEIGIALGNERPLTKAQGRAFLRNLSRMEGNLLDRGRISKRVLVKKFEGYEREGAGRYGLTDEDRETLRAHLGI